MNKNINVFIMLIIISISLGCKKEEQRKLFRKKWKLERHLDRGVDSKDEWVKKYTLELHDNTYSLKCLYKPYTGGAFKNVIEDGEYAYDHGARTLTFKKWEMSLEPYLPSIHPTVKIMQLDDTHFNIKDESKSFEYQLIPY